MESVVIGKNNALYYTAMTFHYIRKDDTNGTIQRVNGMGVGVPIRQLCPNGILPLKSNLELLRFCADILNDAMKNGFVHGAIKIENLAVQNDGSLIINGYDRPRRSSITPEGTMSIPGDIYGMGIVLLELFSGQVNIELPLDQNLHNQKVLEIFLQIDWQEWSAQPWLTTMQEYLISLLFYDPNQRPHPLDIANILKEATQTTSSLGLKEYMKRNRIQVSSSEEKLEAAKSLRSSALISPVEVMADSEGTATGYFTRDKIAQMFQEPIEEEQARRQEWTPETSLEIDPREPTVPSFQDWQESQSLDDTITNSAAVIEHSEPDTSPTPVPPPVSPIWQSQAAQPTNPPQWQNQPPASAPTWQNEPATPVGQTPPPWQSQPTPEPRNPPPTFTSNPVVENNSPVVTIGGGSAKPVPPPPNPPQPIFTTGSNNPHSIPHRKKPGISTVTMSIVGGVIFIALLSLIVWASSVVKLNGVGEVVDSDAVNQNNDNQPSKELTIEQLPINEPTDDFIEEPPPKPKPVERPDPKPKKKNSIKRTTKPPPKPTTPKIKKNTPKPVEKQNPVGFSTFISTITFATEATLQCGDGQSREFVRKTDMTFKGRTTCRITSANGERGALTVQKNGTIQCTIAGEKIRCR